MSTNRTSRLIKAVDWFAFWAALPLLGLLVFLFFWADHWVVDATASPNMATLKVFTTSVVANIIPVFVLFIGSYVVLRKIQEIKTEERDEQLALSVADAVKQEVLPLITELSRPVVIERFNSAPWDDLIRGANRIDITVHYFDTWINQHSDAIKDFFRRKDVKMRIVLPDCECEPLIASLLPRFPEMDENNLKHKIRNVSAKLRTLRDEAGANKSALKVFRINKVQWHCAVRMDDDMAVLSIYENARKGGTQSPAFMVDLAKHPKVSEWLVREFDTLVEGAKLEPEPEA